jgi:hypothetical protein
MFGASLDRQLAAGQAAESDRLLAAQPPGAACQ